MASFSANSIQRLDACNDTNWDTTSAVQDILRNTLHRSPAPSDHPLRFEDETEIHWLLSAIEAHCDVVVDDADITAENFSCVANIAALIERKQLRAAA